MQDLWLAFEGGGSKTRILLAIPGGEVIASAVGSCSNNHYLDPPVYRAEMLELLRGMAAAAGKAGGRVARVGLAGPMEPILVEEILREALGAVPIRYACEGQIALACHDLFHGISVIAGTGSNCTAIDEAGVRVVSGGFGPQFDDYGSAYWIGRKGVAAVVRGEDGRGPATSLRAALLAYAEVGSVWDILRRSDRNGHLPRQFVAGFASRVFDAARGGDVAARGICGGAGRHLGDMVVATAQASAIQCRPIPVVPSGGAFHGADLVLPALRETLEAAGLDVDLYAPVLEPARGLFRILEREGKGVHDGVS